MLHNNNKTLIKAFRPGESFQGWQRERGRASEHMNSPDLGGPVLGRLPQHHMVPVVAPAALHVQDPAFKHLAAHVAQFVDASCLVGQAALGPQHHLGARARRPITCRLMVGAT